MIFFPILSCCRSDNHPLVYLANFDDIQNMKVDNLKGKYTILSTLSYRGQL